MKRIFLSALVTFCCVLITNSSFSQTEKKKIQKNEEIIIRTDDDNKGKTIIVIDSNITINGQPLADYKGDVKVLKRKFMKGNSDNFLFSPREDFKMNNFNTTRTFLGVLTDKSDKGALIKSVTKGSSAEKAGLKEQDIITKFGDKKITNPEDLADIVKTYKPGDEVKMDYLRNGKKKDLKVKLGKTSDAMTFNFNSDSLFFNGKNFNYKMKEFSNLDQLNNLSGSDFNFFNRNQPKLGLRIQDTEDNNGVKILNVEEGSAAEKAGIKKDDIITEVNGEKVNNVDDIRSQLNNSENREQYTIKAKRNNVDMNFEVKVPKKLKTADF